MASIEKARERGRGRLVDKEKEEIAEKPSKRLKVEPQNLDADDPLDESEADDSDSDSDDDETAALMAELQKIKREKAAEEQEKVSFEPPKLFAKSESIMLFAKTSFLHFFKSKSFKVQS